MKRVALLIILVLGLTVLAITQDDDYATSNVNFVVLRDYNGKPVRNASVVIHPVNEKGKQQRNGVELKTDAEGKANFEGVPYGKMRIQVLAPGFQTYGDDYDVKETTMEITVKLKRPQSQYSIYEDHPGDKKDDNQPKPQEKTN